jgi:hypothetical protein
VLGVKYNAALPTHKTKKTVAYAHIRTYKKKSTAIKIKVGANKLCGKVSDNKKKVKSFILFFLFLANFSFLLLIVVTKSETRAKKEYNIFSVIIRMIKFQTPQGRACEQS